MHTTASPDDFDLAKKAISAAPDIRTDMVDDVTSRINAGGYNISVTDLADRILMR
ncbi:MAG: flagellar biosynthesis anti-sigma factor FlgM [Defluviitaleaceae bacterium]|nr:flagellar biosynthesis anti-sigma factor FlgM [Defluviitaleaceae bacterium]